jgi:hypothetical protein
MTDDHIHGEDGHVVVVEPETDPEVTETEKVADASVEIAQIEARSAVAIERERTKQVESADRAEIEALRGELRALRQIVETLAPPEPDPEPDPEPEPEPVPIVVDDPEPEPTEPAPDPTPEPSKKKSDPFLNQY